MEVMRDIMSKNGINLDEIRKIFYEIGGGDCDASIKSSKAYIITMCTRRKQTMWDFVRDAMAATLKDKELSDYQREMANSSLLLAWEELERDNEEICATIHKNAKANQTTNN